MVQWLEILIVVGIAFLIGRCHDRQHRHTARRWLQGLVQEKE